MAQAEIRLDRIDLHPSEIGNQALELTKRIQNRAFQRILDMHEAITTFTRQDSRVETSQTAGAGRIGRAVEAKTMPKEAGELTRLSYSPDANLLAGDEQKVSFDLRRKTGQKFDKKRA